MDVAFWARPACPALPWLFGTALGWCLQTSPSWAPGAGAPCLSALLLPSPKTPLSNPKHHPFSGETEARVVEQCGERGCRLK